MKCAEPWLAAAATILMMLPQTADAQNCDAIKRLLGDRGDPFRRLSLEVDIEKGVSVLIMGESVFQKPAADCELSGPWQRLRVGESISQPNGFLECKWRFASSQKANAFYDKMFLIFDRCTEHELTVDQSGEQKPKIWWQKRTSLENEHRRGVTAMDMRLIAWPAKGEIKTNWIPEYYSVSFDIDFERAER